MFSLVTHGNALLSAINVSKGLVIGKALIVVNSTIAKTVSMKSHMQDIIPSKDFNVDFKDGFHLSAAPVYHAGIDLVILENFAKRVQPFDDGEYKVVVFNKGGRYSMGDIRPDWFQERDYGKTLVVFNTAEEIILEFGGDRNWGPSVIAPSSKVTIDDNNAFLEGYIVAKTFASTNPFLQLDGEPYTGPVQCNC
jgi:hypothetical protein